MASLKEKLASGHVLRGLWQNLPGPEAAELAARVGFDWIVLDGEHGAWDPGDLRAKLIAAPDAILRVPSNTDWILKQGLDLGARTVLVPMVDTAAEAQAAVAACRYPPQGRRGHGAFIARAGMYGLDPTYVDQANDAISVWVQAESRRALENLEEICAIPGVDCIFFGPADLAADMGVALDSPDLEAALIDGVARVVAAGQVAGIFPPRDPEVWVTRGVRVVALGSDGRVLAQGLQALL